MLDIKLITSDIDGTILPHGGKISDETRSAVRMCEENGVKFLIATGRWFVSAKAVAEELGQKDAWMIICNGGAIVDMNDEPIVEWTMSPEDVKKADDIMRRYDVMYNAFVAHGIYRVNTKAYKSELKGMAGYFGEDYRIVNDDWDAFEKYGLVNPYKLEAYSDDTELLAKLREELVATGLAVTSSYPCNLEIMSPGKGKGEAVRWLAQHMGITMEQCMAFGDNTNDLPMLSSVGWPVAVENAVDKLKKHARIIAPACEENGVAQVIMNRIFGKD